MPAARYWRVARIETYLSGDLELSEVALYEGASRVDGSATITSVVSPASGSLSALSDASFSTSVRWDAEAVGLPGFGVVWDFGAGVTKDVTSVSIAGPSQATFAHKFALEYSSNGAEWTRLYKAPKGSKYPGAAAFWTLDASGAASNLAGLVLVQNSGDVTMWRLEPGGSLVQFPFGNAFPGGRAMSVSADGRFIAQADNSNTYDPRKILVYERGGDEFAIMPRVDVYPDNHTQSIAISPDGIYFAAVGVSPYLTWYKRTDTAMVKLTNPVTMPTSSCAFARWSPDGVYLAIAQSGASPYILIYKRSGDTLTRLGNPATLPAASAYCVAWNHDGSHLAVAHSASPFVTIYSRSGDVFTKLANPATLPGGNATSVAFSSDGTYLVVGHISSPFITIYKWDGSAYVKVANPAVLPGPPGEVVNDVAFDPTDTYLACALIGIGGVRLVVYSRSGDVFTRMADPTGVPSNSSGISVAWFASSATSPGLLPANYDAAPVRTTHIRSLSLGYGDSPEGAMTGSATTLNIDIEDGGRGRIVDTVKEKSTPSNIPLRRRVVLQNHIDKRTIRETWSDPVTGEYRFEEIALGRTYDVLSYDHTGTYRGVMADNLAPEVMP